MTLQNSADLARYASTLNAKFSDFEEAARYVLLQHLAPALRHHVMGNFQSIGLISAMMERRLRSAAPDLASIRENCASFSSASQMTVDAITRMMAWIAPPEDTPLNFDTGLKECLSLLTTELRFKGFVIANEAPALQTALSSRALRSVLCATLMALSERTQAPARLVIRAQAMPDSIVLSIELHPLEGHASNVRSSPCRPLTWQDTEILAVADSVQLTHGPEGAQLIFPHFDATT
ncbi:MAG: hypothetical protein NTZ64_06790 [Polaromonas sp.]|nr:hypothetical protein [Polaromonas sp.]